METIEHEGITLNVKDVPEDQGCCRGCYFKLSGDGSKCPLIDISDRMEGLPTGLKCVWDYDRPVRFVLDPLYQDFLKVKEMTNEESEENST